jgi:predicted lipoprotein with Yx(FWY)xxD motif
MTCTGPESDILNNVDSDDWPALTTTGAPVAGPGVNRQLLGTVYRPGIGRQVTYGGHPLYTFDAPSKPFLPEGEGYFETVAPLLPWHGLWDLVSSRGQPAPGVATIETETLPDGRTALAAQEYTNVLQAAVSVYSFSRDAGGQSTCTGACTVTWVPVLTTGRPHVAGAISTKDLGVIGRSDGTDQVTYEGEPLYLYAAEQFVFPTRGYNPQSTGTVGNGNGLAGPGGGKFSLIYPG